MLLGKNCIHAASSWTLESETGMFHSTICPICKFCPNSFCKSKTSLKPTKRRAPKATKERQTLHCKRFYTKHRSNTKLFSPEAFLHQKPLHDRPFTKEAFTPETLLAKRNNANLKTWLSLWRREATHYDERGLASKRESTWKRSLSLIWEVGHTTNMKSNACGTYVFMQTQHWVRGLANVNKMWIKRVHFRCKYTVEKALVDLWGWPCVFIHVDIRYTKQSHIDIPSVTTQTCPDPHFQGMPGLTSCEMQGQLAARLHPKAPWTVSPHLRLSSAHRPQHQKCVLSCDGTVDTSDEDPSLHRKETIWMKSR